MWICRTPPETPQRAVPESRRTMRLRGFTQTSNLSGEMGQWFDKWGTRGDRGRCAADGLTDWSSSLKKRQWWFVRQGIGGDAYKDMHISLFSLKCHMTSTLLGFLPALRAEPSDTEPAKAGHDWWGLILRVHTINYFALGWLLVAMQLKPTKMYDLQNPALGGNRIVIFFLDIPFWSELWPALHFLWLFVPPWLVSPVAWKSNFFPLCLEFLFCVFLELDF